jgi:hypothetical protein
MAEFKFQDAELTPLIKRVVQEVLDALGHQHLLLNNRLAVTEPEAAELMDLNPWQLRDVRLAEKIGFSRIVGNKVRYTAEDLLAYLRQNHQRGSKC